MFSVELIWSSAKHETKLIPWKHDCVVFNLFNNFTHFGHYWWRNRNYWTYLVWPYIVPQIIAIETELSWKVFTTTINTIHIRRFIVLLIICMLIKCISSHWPWIESIEYYLVRTKTPAKTAHFECRYHCVYMVKFRHEETTLRDIFMRKYWINLSENVCGSCLDIYLSGGERIYWWIYYSWIYGCLKLGYVAVVTFNRTWI